MKQLAFMIAVTLIGVGGTLAYSPFIGVFVYWFYAVLRPHFMWEWALAVYPQVQWSFIVAIVVMVAAGIQLLTAPSEPGKGRFSRTHFYLFTFVVVFCFSYLAIAEDKLVGELVFWDMVKLLTMLVVSTILITTVRQIWALYLMVVLVLGYIALEANLLYLQHHYLTFYQRGYCGLDNNGAALMIAMGAPMAFFAWQGIKRWWRWGLLLFIPIIVHGVLISYSRGAMLSLVVVVPILFLRSRHKFWFALFGIVMAYLLPVMAGREIRARFFSIEQHDVDASAKSRRLSWNAAISIIETNPLFGVGPRNSMRLTHLYGAEPGKAIHNVYLQIGADAGLIGLSLYLLTLGSGWLASRRIRRHIAGRTDEEAIRILAMTSGMECAMIVFCTGAVFLSVETFDIPYFLVFLTAQLWSLLRIREMEAQPQSDGAIPWQAPIVANGVAYPARYAVAR